MHAVNWKSFQIEKYCLRWSIVLVSNRKRSIWQYWSIWPNLVSKCAFMRKRAKPSPNRALSEPLTAKPNRIDARDPRLTCRPRPYHLSVVSVLIVFAILGQTKSTHLYIYNQFKRRIEVMMRFLIIKRHNSI